MKFNLKEALYKYNILNENWMENLSNKYSEDLLILVGRMLQQAYPDKDISNHPLAEWIAKTAKKMGDLPWAEPHKTRNENSFQKILEFVKSKNDDKEIINKIKSLPPKEALEYIETESKKKDEEDEELSGEEELKSWIDEGLLRIVGRGPKNSFWITPLKGEFFGVAQCGPLTSMSDTKAGEFGIGCQKGARGGSGAQGIGSSTVNTYTLLAKAKNGHYTGIISFAGNINTGEFIGDAASFGNVVIGAQTHDYIDWTKKDFLKAFVDFLINNPEGKKIYKSDPNNPKPRAFGELIKKENQELFYELLRNKPEFVEFYEPFLQKHLTEEEYALLKIKARELYEKDPKKFIENLPTYLRTEKQESLKILSEINFENFINQYGQEVVLKNIESILGSMDYEKFQNLIKPFIDYDRFLERTKKADIKEIIRNFAEKSQSAKKTFPIVNEMIESEKDFEAILKNFGNGNLENGLRAFLASLSTPRMSKHKNYLKTKDGVQASVREKKRDNDGNLLDSNGRKITLRGNVLDVDGNVIDFEGDNVRMNNYIDSRVAYETKNVPVETGQWILDYKSIRDLLKRNKEKIVKILGGGKDAEIKYIELFLNNSSAQERKAELKNVQDDYLDYYDKLYAEGKSDLPGILKLSKVLASEREIGTGDDKKKIFSNMKTSNSVINDNFEGTARYIFGIEDKELFKKSIKNILNFYSKNSKSSSKIDKNIDAFSALIDTAKFAKFSVIELIDFSQSIINGLYRDGASPEQLLRFLYNVSNIIPNSSVLKDFIIKNLKENEISKKIQFVNKKDPRTGRIVFNQQTSDYLKGLNTITNSIEDKNIQEQKIRKYIQNLLESKLSNNK